MSICLLPASFFSVKEIVTGIPSIALQLFSNAGEVGTKSHFLSQDWLLCILNKRSRLVMKFSEHTELSSELERHFSIFSTASGHRRRSLLCQCHTNCDLHKSVNI
jgi:hypothetical protein